MISSSPLSRRERRVLVVDDNLDVARSFAIMVERMGHKVEFAINGYAALQLAQKFQPEVVFLDLVMPGMHGLELARRLKQTFGDGVRIIVVTAHQEEDRVKSAKAGCELHLLKPVEESVIESLLH
jgi:CheY-like chemotaxis protein